MNDAVNQLITKGIALKKAGDWEGAKKCYLQAIDLNPTNMKAFISLGKTAHLLQQQDLAVRCYLAAAHLMLEPIEKEINNNPDQLSVYLRRHYRGFSKEALQQLPRQSAFAILIDRNIPNHSAHSVIDLNPDHMKKRPDLIPFSEIYRASILGDGSRETMLNLYDYTSNDQIKIDQEIYKPEGETFLLNQIEWDRIDSQNVVEIYFKSGHSLG